MIDKRLGYVAAIALCAAAATAYVIAPRDSISLALGMGRTSLPPNEQQLVPATYRTEEGAAIGADWFRPNRCSYGNGLLAVSLGGTKVTISPLDVDHIDLAWNETWTQDTAREVVLHKTSGCGERPVIARTLATKPLGSFQNGIVLWTAHAKKRDVETYVSKLTEIRTGAQCYVEQGLRLCADPTAENRDGGAAFYAFTDDASKLLPSGAPWNLRCQAATGKFDPNSPRPLVNVECQLADIAPSGYNYMAKIYDRTMIGGYRFGELNNEIRARLESFR